MHQNSTYRTEGNIFIEITLLYSLFIHNMRRQSHGLSSGDSLRDPPRCMAARQNIYTVHHDSDPQRAVSRMKLPPGEVHARTLFHQRVLSCVR
jgi:hypothetical protein